MSRTISKLLVLSLSACALGSTLAVADDPASRPTSKPAKPGTKPGEALREPAVLPKPAQRAGLELDLRPQGDWVVGKPSSRMRAAQFTLPAREGGKALELVVYHFGKGSGGGVQANVERWLGQIKQPDGSETEEVAKRSAYVQSGLAITTVDVSGTYVAMTRPGSGVRQNVPDSRLLGAVIEGGDGPYYVKLIGHEDDVAHHLEGYRAFLSSLNALHPTKRRRLVFEAAPTWTPVAPTSKMRSAEFLLPGLEDADDPRVVVYHFGRGQGGDVAANKERWVKQFQTLEGEPTVATFKSRTWRRWEGRPTAKGKWPESRVKVTLITIRGTLGAAGRPGAPAAKPKPGTTMLAAVLEGWDGPYFVKIAGPSATIAKHAKAFRAFLETGISIQPSLKP